MLCEDEFWRRLSDLEKVGSVQRRMTPALEVLTRLFPHQQEALAWMVRSRSPASQACSLCFLLLVLDCRNGHMPTLSPM